MIRAVLLRLLGLDKLQKAHDLRAVLNARLSEENQRLRKELGRYGTKKKPKPPTPPSPEKKVLAAIRSQRQDILTDLLRDFVSEERFRTLCDEVNNLTDEQVMAYRKPTSKGR